MATAAAGGSPGSTVMAMASEMDPEETEYLACPTIADDSLAHQGVSDVGQGGRKCCDGLRRTPGMVRGFVLPGSEQITAAYFRLPSTSGTGSGCIGASTSSSSSFFSTLSTLSSDLFDCSRPTNHRHLHLCGNTTTTHAHTFSDGPVCQNLDLVDDHLF